MNDIGNIIKKFLLHFSSIDEQRISTLIISYIATLTAILIGVFLKLISANILHDIVLAQIAAIAGINIWGKKKDSTVDVDITEPIIEDSKAQG